MLPVMKECDPARPAVESSHPASILYIEDNPASQHLMRRILACRPNTRLLTSTTGTEGIQKSRDYGNLLSLILMDLSLPDMDGFQALKEIRKSLNTKHIPVIAVTARAMTDEVERGLSAEFSHYLTKPLDISSFTKLIDSMIDISNRR